MSWHFVWEEEHFLLDHLWGEFTHDFEFSFVFCSTFWSSSIDSKVEWLVLVCMCERVEKTVSLAIVILILKHVTSVSEPGWLWDFVVE